MTLRLTCLGKKPLRVLTIKAGNVLSFGRGSLRTLNVEGVIAEGDMMIDVDLFDKRDSLSIYWQTTENNYEE